MVEVSLFRLYLLRAMYLFIVAGFGVFIWPGILHHKGPWELMQGVVNCMLIAFWTLAIRAALSLADAAGAAVGIRVEDAVAAGGRRCRPGWAAGWTRRCRRMPSPASSRC
jgi:hypothetical protein